MNKKQRKEKKQYKKIMKKETGVKDCYVYPSIYFARWNRWRARCREHNRVMSGTQDENEYFGFRNIQWD